MKSCYQLNYNNYNLQTCKVLCINFLLKLHLDYARELVIFMCFHVCTSNPDVPYSTRIVYCYWHIEIEVLASSLCIYFDTLCFFLAEVGGISSESVEELVVVVVEVNKNACLVKKMIHYNNKATHIF